MGKQVKVKVVNKGPFDGFCGLRDTTLGAVYKATQYTTGEIKDIDGEPAERDSFQFTDDVGDYVFIWSCWGGVVVVEE